MNPTVSFPQNVRPGASFRVWAFCIVGLASITFALSAGAGTTSYQYDTLGRVVKVTYPDSKQICYQYDKAGNRTQVTKAATGTCTPPSTTLMAQATAPLEQNAIDDTAAQASEVGQTASASSEQ